MDHSLRYFGIVSDKDKAGYYSGILISSYMFGSILMSYFWGRFADRYGRRKVLLIGLSSTVTLSLAFGFSQTFWMALLCRFLLGACDGIVIVSKVLVSEICGKEHEIVGMGAITTAWSMSLALGTGLGGILVEPATHFPSVFSESGLFGRFPFLLPNILSAGLGLVALPLVLLFVSGYEKPVDENNREKIEDLAEIPLAEVKSDTPVQRWSESPDLRVFFWHRFGGKHGGDGRERGEAPFVRMASGTVTPSKQKNPSWVLADDAISQPTTNSEIDLDLNIGSKGQGDPFKNFHVYVHLVNFGMYSFLYTGFDAVLFLWAISTIGSGGLDWTTQRIGQVTFTSGVFVLIFEIVTVPCITAKLGIKWSQRLGTLFETPAYVSIPMLAWFMGTGLEDFACAILIFTICACSNSFYLAISLAINNSTDILHRGEVNAMAKTIVSITKTLGPAVFSALFTFSIDGDHPFPFDVHLVWFTLAIARAFIGFVAWKTINDYQEREEETDNDLEQVELDVISVDSSDGYESMTEAAATSHNLFEVGRTAEGEEGMYDANPLYSFRKQ